MHDVYTHVQLLYIVYLTLFKYTKHILVHKYADQMKRVN